MALPYEPIETDSVLSIPAPATSGDLPAPAMPTLDRIVVIDPVGPQAANRQHRANEKRTLTLLAACRRLQAICAAIDSNYLRVDGGTQKNGVSGMNADLVMNGRRVTGLAAGNATGHAARYDELLTETNARTNADTTLTNNLAAETTARTNADASLMSSLSSEVSARTSADDALSSGLAFESAARIAGDSALSTQIAGIPRGVASYTVLSVGAGTFTPARTGWHLVTIVGGGEGGWGGSGSSTSDTDADAPVLTQTGFNLDWSGYPGSDILAGMGGRSGRVVSVWLYLSSGIPYSYEVGAGGAGSNGVDGGNAPAPALGGNSRFGDIIVPGGGVRVGPAKTTSDFAGIRTVANNPISLPGTPSGHNGYARGGTAGLNASGGPTTLSLNTGYGSGHGGGGAGGVFPTVVGLPATNATGGAAWQGRQGGNPGLGFGAGGGGGAGDVSGIGSGQGGRGADGLIFIAN